MNIFVLDKEVYNLTSCTPYFKNNKIVYKVNVFDGTFLARQDRLEN